MLTCEAAFACKTAACAAAKPTSLIDGDGATTGSASSTGCTSLPAKLATFTAGRWGRLPTCGSSGSVLSAAAFCWHLQHGHAVALCPRPCMKSCCSDSGSPGGHHEASHMSTHAGFDVTHVRAARTPWCNR